MNIIQSTKKELYYTKDHDWIDFQGIIAYIGICKFKLTGFKQIQSIHFHDALGFKRKEDVIATIKYNDYVIEAHMPVEGRVLNVNNTLTPGNLNILLECCESSAWIALIEPSDPLERDELLLPKQYHLTGKSK